MSMSKRTRRAGTILSVVLGCMLLATATAQGEDHHHTEVFSYGLDSQVLCVAPESVVIDLQGVDDSRGNSARIKMLNSLRSSLNRVVRTASVSAVSSAAAGSCSDSDSFVALVVQVRSLDPDVYTRYGPQSFSYSLWVQVGRYAGESYLAGNNFLLPESRFVAFQEDAFSEIGRGQGFEDSIALEADRLLGELVGAWQEANP